MGPYPVLFATVQDVSEYLLNGLTLDMCRFMEGSLLIDIDHSGKPKKNLKITKKI